MGKIYCLFTIILILILTTACYPQGEYLTNEESGVGLLFSIDKDKIISGNSIGGGYSLNGRYDIDLYYGFGNAKNNNPYGLNQNDIITYKAIQLSLSFNFLKPDSLRKLGAAISMGFQSTTFTSNPGFWYPSRENTTSSVFIGLNLFGLKTYSLFNVLPSVSASGLFSNGGVDLIISLGLGVKLNLPNNFSLIISPSGSFYPLTAPKSNGTNYSLSLVTGFLISFK